MLLRSVVTIVAVSAGALVCWAPSNEPASRRPTASPAAADHDARLVLERHCGLCHREDSPSAKKGALAVFNLNRAEWYASLSETQLKSARSRLADAPTGGDPASPEELAQFDAFVRARR
jgi:mono/diheme cytochrome c family protein